MRDLDLDDVPDHVRSLLDDAAAPRARWARRCCASAQARRGRRDRRGADRACRPLDGRRLWFVGIGGAGLSAYAQLARAWGAEVGGWDRVRDAVPRAARRHRGRDLARAGRAGRLGGGRLVGVPRRRRAPRAPSSSPSSSGCGRSIVVAGTHGKGTTAAMIAFVAARDRARPGVADRRAGAAARQQRRARGRAGSSSRATSPTGRCSACRRRSPWSRTSSSTTTASSRSLAELEAEFERWTARRPHARPRRAAVRRPARAARRAQPRERGHARSPRSSSRASTAAEAAAALGRFTGHGPALRGLRGRRRDDRRRLRPPSRRDRRDDRRRARGVSGPAACACSSSRTSTRARGTSPTSSAPRSPPPTTSSSPTSTRRARQPIPGVSGKLVVDALSDRGRVAGVDPRRWPQAAALPRGEGAARATCCSCSAPATSTPRRRSCARSSAGAVRRDRARGGRAALAPHDDRHRRAGAAASRGRRRSTSSRSCSAGPPPTGSRSRRSGSARTCSSHDDGVDALVLRLEGDARRRRASRATIARRRRRRDERGLPAPRPRRGARRARVRLGDPGHGRRRRPHERRRLRQRLARRAGRRDRRRGRRPRTRRHPGELGLAYRHSGLAPGEVVAQVRFRLAPRPVDEIKAEVASCSRSGRRPSRRRSAPSAASSRTRPARPGAGRADRGVRPEGAPDRRRASSPSGTRTSSRTPAVRPRADALALMAEARRRVHERFGVELEHEVRFLGPARAAAAVRTRVGKPGERRSPVRGCPQDRLCPRRRVAGLEASLDARRLLPTRRSLVVASALVVCAAAAYAVAPRRRCSRSATSRSRAARRVSRPRCAQALAPELGRSLLRVVGRRDRPPGCRRPGRGLGSPSTARFPHTLRVTRRAPSAAVLLAAPGNEEPGSSRRAARVMRQVRDPAPQLAAAPVGAEGHRRRGRSDARARPTGRSRRRRSPRSPPAPSPARCVRSVAGQDELTLVLRLGRRGPARRHRRPAAEARDRAGASSALAGAASGERHRYVDVSVPERPVLGSRTQLNRSKVEGTGA